MSLFRILTLLFITFPSFSQTDFVDSLWSFSKEYNLRGERDSSVDVLLENIKILEKSDEKDIIKLSSIYNKLGLKYQIYGNWGESALAYIRSMELLVDTDEYNKLKSEVYLNLGLLYVKTGSSSSEYYLEIAEELALEEKNDPVLFILYKATNRLKEGVKLARKTNNNQYLSNYYYLLARTNDSVLSSLYFDSCRYVLPKLPESKLQNFQYHAYIVDYFLKNNQLDSALFHCKKAEEISALINDDEVNHHYLGCYESYYLAKEDYKNVWKYRKMADSVESNYLTSNTKIVLDSIDKRRVFAEKDEKIVIFENRQRVYLVVIISILLILIVIYISSRRINKKNKELQESNESRDRLFSIISHDLRGVVSSIKDLSKSERNIDKIRNASNSLLLEFDSLLHWSAKHLDNLEYNPKIIDVNETIDEILSLSSFQSNLKNIEVEICFKEEFIIYADENMFKVILRNIINNAIKYSKPKSKISVMAVENNGIFLLSIQDSGFGFSHKYTNKGLGLGLELCKDFLKINNGELIIESSTSGSVITISFPIEESN
ncbi:MAG: HAMP domain-containing sensor histidine kinase [Flavobacteriales bacterium]|nr:HAMP domain-containing sensor histidine kinase [Flavobacteriales bacterium]